MFDPRFYFWWWEETVIPLSEYVVHWRFPSVHVNAEMNTQHEPSRCSDLVQSELPWLSSHSPCCWSEITLLVGFVLVGGDRYPLSFPGPPGNLGRPRWNHLITWPASAPSSDLTCSPLLRAASAALAQTNPSSEFAAPVVPRSRWSWGK